SGVRYDVVSVAGVAVFGHKEAQKNQKTCPFAPRCVSPKITVFWRFLAHQPQEFPCPVRSRNGCRTRRPNQHTTSTLVRSETGAHAAPASSRNLRLLAATVSHLSSRPVRRRSPA